ncbi:hypothetical protein EDC04DRAFT_2614211 [Pisolithus marmoratus]|nr:hypothetical protein EDC04DRAFT_2614211 [Pisolithus marmoratus]
MRANTDRLHIVVQQEISCTGIPQWITGGAGADPQLESVNYGSFFGKSRALRVDDVMEEPHHHPTAVLWALFWAGSCRLMKSVIASHRHPTSDVLLILSDLMIEPTHPVIFSVLLPPLRGLELERDNVPVCHQIFRRLIQDARECGVKGEEYDTIKLTDWSTRADTSKMHVGDSNVRTLPAETGSAARQCRILNSGPVEAPPSSPDCYSHALQGGDLFVHTHDHGRQAWMWGESGWMLVQEARSGEPSWVTGKTMATYHLKNRKCLP